MKKAIFIRLIPALLMLATWMAGCTGGPSLRPYSLDVTFDDSLRHDTVTLTIVEPDYGATRQAGQWLLASETPCHFEGQMENERLCYLTFGEGGRRFYMVLHPGHISLEVKGDRWRIAGSKPNAWIAQAITFRNKSRQERASIARQYLAAIGDTTLNADLDSTLWARDSLLADTLQRMEMMADTCHDLRWQALRHHRQSSKH